ncbi:MAG TPA: MBOAT family O-acyltransferase [Sphingobacteriaceae bacterium]|nr:MBOAT family O-acyltransferase [Sphingobacteriaceae bacterium]
MLFTSSIFLVFSVLFFLIYWVFSRFSLLCQNGWLLIGSYIFYGWTNWMLLFILVAVSSVNFLCGRRIINKSKIVKPILFFGILFNVGTLVYFKYANFFIESFRDIFGPSHLENLSTAKLIIPLGISYYTFRNISYLLDISREKYKPVKNWLVYYNYVSFFPSLLAGPIDRANNFVPQLILPRKFDKEGIKNGLRQFLWGLFKKIVIADNCAIVTDAIFDSSNAQSGSSILVGLFIYTLQIYADFSGYSDMAIGTARMLGFNLVKNFNFPLYSKSIPEFWRKWHISLTSWLSEYIFTPLNIAFRNLGRLGIVLAIVINFTICGIWHGANTNYIVFGFVHGLFFIPSVLKFPRLQDFLTRRYEFVNDLLGFLATFLTVMFTFAIFKAKSITIAIDYYLLLFSRSIWTVPTFSSGKTHVAMVLLLCISLLVFEWYQRNREHGLTIHTLPKHRAWRWVIYSAILFTICFLMPRSNSPFIYTNF